MVILSQDNIITFQELTVTDLSLAYAGGGLAGQLRGTLSLPKSLGGYSSVPCFNE